MVTRRGGAGPCAGGLLVALAAPMTLGACLSSPANDYLYNCSIEQSCPAGAGCASDGLCHPVYVMGAGPSDAGAYLCASTSPDCPDGQVCSDGLCSAGDAGSMEMPDAGDAGPPDAGPPDAGPKPCDLATAFGGSSPVSCGVDCGGLAVADFNHDGYADVVVTVDPDNNNKGGLAVLLNDGTGSLGAPKVTRSLYNCGNDPDFPEYTSPDALAVADFNGDGWPDLGLSIQQSSQLALAINDQDGGFTVGGFQPGTSPNCGFVNGGGYSAISAYQAAGDWYLAAVGYGLTDSDFNSVVVVSQVKNNGQSLDPFDLLDPAQDYAPIGVTVGLFANDPLPSAVVSEESEDTGAGQIELFSGTSSGTLDRLSSPSSQTLICQQETQQITSADLNGDGLLDLVTVNFTSNTVEVFYAKDGGFRSGVSFPVGFPTDMSDAGPQPVGAVVADLDGDGRSDIATVNSAGSISILKGLTDGGFLLVAVKETTAQAPFWISAVDLEDRGMNDGGRPDLVVSYLSGANSSAVDVYYNGCR